MTLQSDGKVVMVGSFEIFDPVTFAGTTAFAMTRITAAGGLDTGFGNGGRATTSFNGVDEAAAVLIRKDGTIVVAGFSFDPTALLFDNALAEYDSNGILVWGHKRDKKAGQTK